VWLTTKDAATYAKRSTAFITRALRSGELRGNQPGRKGTWLVHREDLDAWIRGEIADVEVPFVTRRRPNKPRP
jgi:excisionase family DNA binding protein